MIKPLSYKKVISLVEEIPTTGHSPLKVMAEDNEIYFLKDNQGRFPAYELASEIICHYLLKIWGIPTPSVSILELDLNIFRDELKRFSFRHKASYFNLPSVGSLALASPVIELNSLTQPIEEKDLQNIVNQLDIWKIGLFDIWVENDDRKPSNPNLLQQIISEGIKIFAIDHAFTFGTLAYKQLNPAWGITQGFNDNILETDLAKKLYELKGVDKSEIQDFFVQKVTECEQSFAEILKNIPKEFGLNIEDTQNITNFLFDKTRNELVIQAFFEHLSTYV